MACKVPKFIIDTDPGIDDAMGLCMALEQHKRGKIQILAISLVCGNTTINFQKINILRILKLFPELYGKIPVYVGCQEGLVHRHVYTDRFHGIDGFNMVVFDDMPKDDPDNPIIQDEPSAVAMVRFVAQYPGEICLVHLGPLTNVALSTKLDPDFFSKIKHIYIMGGSMEAIGNTTSMAEFNFYADPESAHVILRKLEGLKPTKATIVTWELCHNYFYISWDWRLNILGNSDDPRAKLLNTLEDKWEKERDFGEQWILCDQLIVAVALDHNCVLESVECHASVELHGIYTRGLMAIDKRSFVKDSNDKINVNIVKKMDIDLVKKYLLAGLGHKD